MKAYRLQIFFISICFLLTGCENVAAFGQKSGEMVSDYAWEASGGEVDLSYEVPPSGPNILVNQLGYEPDGNKTAIFRGENLGPVFNLRRADTGEVVYTGDVKAKGYDEFSGEDNSYGIFTDFITPGEYYVQMDGIGESYRFSIRENLYYPLLERSCLQYYEHRDARGPQAAGASEGWLMNEKGRNKEVTACRSLLNLLLSYEIFPEVFGDETGISESGNGIPDILDECRYEVEWLLEQAQTTPDENGELCAWRTAALAKFAYFYRSMDNAFAGSCLKVAENAWNSARKDLTVPEDLLALAAAEMYRLTGSSQYQKVITAYLEGQAAKEGVMTELGFYSGLTYLNMKNRVDVSLCDKVIKKLMKEAEDISEKSRQQNYLVYSEKEAADTEAMLMEMIRLSVVNHIITNHEYNTVIENHFHYLMGRNPQGICYVGEVGSAHAEGADVFENAWQNSAFLFMVSELMSN